MRRFVRDDVMRQTGENNSAGKLHARRRARSWKIPEDERLALRTVESVRAAKRVRINTQPRLERFPFACALSFIAADPKNSPPERALEIADYFRRDRARLRRRCTDRPGRLARKTRRSQDRSRSLRDSRRSDPAEAVPMAGGKQFR